MDVPKDTIAYMEDTQQKTQINRSRMSGGLLTVIATDIDSRVYGVADPTQWPPYMHSHSPGEEDFIFAEEDFEMPAFTRATDELEFIWENKDGIVARVRIEPPYRIHRESITNTNEKHNKKPGSILRFNPRNKTV